MKIFCSTQKGCVAWCNICIVIEKERRKRGRIAKKKKTPHHTKNYDEANKKIISYK